LVAVRINDIVGQMTLIITLLQIYDRMCQVKKNWNWLILCKDMTKLLVACFF